MSAKAASFRTLCHKSEQHLCVNSITNITNEIITNVRIRTLALVALIVSTISLIVLLTLALRTLALAALLALIAPRMRTIALNSAANVRTRNVRINSATNVASILVIVLALITLLV